MPPTTGHLQLLQFANKLAPDGVVAIINTQPHEPFPKERAGALRAAIKRVGLARRVKLIHYKKAIEQDPQTPGFWDMWHQMMIEFGVTPDDIIVASERYGKKLAEITGTQFFPYDIDRTINPAKATHVRTDPLTHFADIVPEFQPYLRTRVTIFGAESTGKTTLSREVAEALGATWLFEYARPYLEETVNEITSRSMTAIWQGQRALQAHAAESSASPFIIQDTDLFSTVGYWQFPHWQPTIGDCPEELIHDALHHKSDLYIVTKSNIPFEADPLRYGGDKREGSDDYWISLCDHYRLPYVVLETNDPHERHETALQLIKNTAQARTEKLWYDRHDL